MSQVTRIEELVQQTSEMQNHAQNLEVLLLSA